MPPIHRLLPLAIALVLAGLAIGDGGRVEPIGAEPPAAVSLSEIARRPRDFLGQELRFTIQLESQPAQWNPYLTRFGIEDYRALIAWGDEHDLWLRDEFDSPRAMLFVRRQTAAAQPLDKAPRYARFEVSATVRQILLSRPWIEITALAPLTEQLTEGSLIHAGRGVEFMAAGKPEFAAQSFERALAGVLPERARGELMRLRDVCLGAAPRPAHATQGNSKNPVAPGGLR